MLYLRPWGEFGELEGQERAPDSTTLALVERTGEPHNGRGCPASF